MAIRFVKRMLSRVCGGRCTCVFGKLFCACPLIVSLGMSAGYARELPQQEALPADTRSSAADLPAPRLQADTDPSFELPPVPAPPAAATLSGGVHIYVTGISFTGNTVFSDQVLGALAASYRNRLLSIEDLHALRQEITRTYIDAGYINSGALLPDQSVEDGNVVYRIVEGVLGEIDVRGMDSTQPAYITSRLEPFASAPLNVNLLQSGLLLLQEDPLVESLQARLQPAESPGVADLEVDIDAARPWEISLVADNNRSPSTGANELTLGVLHRSLSGRGDALSLAYSLSSGTDQYATSYRLPFHGGRSAVRAYYRHGESQVIETAFRDIEIENDSDAAGLEVSRVLFRSLASEFVIGAGLERKKTRTFMLGEPCSVKPGVG